MKTCPQCGCEVTENAKFCKNCGSEIRENEINNNNAQVCPNCGQKLDEGIKFCNSCGYEIAQKDKKDNKIIFCSNCGTKLSSDTKYCPECGLSPTEQPQYKQAEVVVKSNKSPLISAILSFFIPGLGQAYLGLMKKGILLFMLAMIGGALMSVVIGYILYIIVWGYAMYDGYISAEKINDDIKVEDKLDLNNLF